MEDKELKLVEVEASHTLGGSGEGRMLGRGKWRGCRCYSVGRYTKQTHLIIVSLAENSGRMPGVVCFLSSSCSTSTPDCA